MRPELAALAAAQHGVFLRSQALECGYTDEDLRRSVRDGVLTRIRRGAYVDAELWSPLDEAGRHALLARVTLLRVDQPAVASHCSAAALLGLPLYNADLRHVHVTRPEVHFGRIRAGVVHHEASVDEIDIVDAEGSPCTSLRRTALDVARRFGFEAGVVCADAALARGVDPTRLEALAQGMRTWPGSRPVLPVVRFADGGAETPGESLARMFLVSIGLPAPRTQVLLEAGSFAARVDMLIEEYDWAVEFDGRMKYRRSRDDCDPVVDDADVVWAEKQREDELRGLTRAVSRLVWADLFGARRQVAAARLWRTADRLGVPRRRWPRAA
jgi:Transcriptional regulator, AbiEi antitoxin